MKKLMFFLVAAVAIAGFIVSPAMAFKPGLPIITVSAVESK
ncbi:MAG TPA: hypothetical protein VJ084_00875 [Nitrospinota bacterium]|nr:hypothetical protein [Nitrospinota bacterium]